MKKFASFTLALGLMASLAACGSAASSSSPAAPSSQPASAPAPSSLAAPAQSTTSATAEQENLVVDTAAGTVTLACEVNGKYFTESTRHGIVYADGSNGEKAVLRGLANQEDFYNALIEIGGEPGNNVSMADMEAKASAEGAAVEGSPLDVTISWDGSEGELPFADVIKASEQRPMDIRFGGNLEAAKEYKTGCILCLDSCAVGITSNAAYPTGTTQNSEVEFFGNDQVLPKDGTLVYVTFMLAGPDAAPAAASTASAAPASSVAAGSSAAKA